MRIYDSSNIRNVGILGHSGSGKSNMVEGAGIYGWTYQSYRSQWKWYKNLLIPWVYMPLSIRLRNLILWIFQDMEIFFGEVESGLAAVDGAIIIVDGTTDLTVGTETALELTDSRNIPRFIL